MKKTAFIFLLIIFFAHLFYRIFLYRSEYLTRFDPKYWEYRYLHSQWVIPDSKESIGDDGLYAYAGWKYITGADPTLVNPEIPPVGKYLIGLSIVIFGSQNIFALLVGFFTLLAFYKLNLHLFKDRLFAFLPVLLFSLEPLFYQQLRAPYLDLLHLLFLLLTFLFLFKKRYIFAGVFIGLFASTKFSSLAFLLLIVISVYFLFQQKKHESIQFLKSLMLVPIIFLLSYFRYFLLGHSVHEFLGVQKFIVNFYAVGAKVPAGIVFPMFLFGKWHTWWNGVISISEWTILWPLLFLLTLVTFINEMKAKRVNEITLLLLWVFFYFVFLAIIPVAPRYLLLLLPFMYNLAIWVFSKNIPHRLF